MSTEASIELILMQFKCPKCDARYEIANDKVPEGKTLRFSCKKCGAGIRIRRKEKKPKEESFDGPTEPTGVRAFVSQPPPEPPGELSDANWFALVAGRRVGPMARFELERMIAGRDVDGQTYVWCAGMTDWQRLRFIPEFAQDLDALGTAPWRVVMPLDDDDTQADQIPAQAASATGKEISEEEKAGTLAEELPAEDSVPTDAAEKEANDLLESLADMSPVDAAIAESKKTGSFDGAIESSGEEPPPVPSDASTEAEDFEEATDRVDAPFTGEQEPMESVKSDILGEDAEPFESGRLVQALDDATTLSESFAEETSPNPFVGNVPDINTVREELDDNALHEIDSFAPAFDTNEREVPLTTGFFMESAGLNRRRRNHRLAMIVSITFTVTLVGVASLDLFGIIELPGMGRFYDLTGLEDPNKGRKIERIEKKIAQAPANSTDREELEDLRYKLMGIKPPKKKKARRNRGGRVSDVSALGGRSPAAKAKPRRKEKVKQVGELTSPDDMFGSLRKKSFSTESFSKEESAVKAKVQGGQDQASLPDGLSQESIYKIIKEKNAAMSMCMK